MPQSLSWSPQGHWLAYSTADRSTNFTVHCIDADSVHHQAAISFTDFQSIAQSVLPVQSTNPGAGGTSPAPPTTTPSTKSTPPTRPSFSWLPNTNVLRVQWNNLTLLYLAPEKRWIAQSSAQPGVIPSPKSKPFQFPKLPDGAQESQFSPNKQFQSYILSNNLYVVRESSTPRITKPTPITRDGSSTLLNGLYSWVYWEEIMNRATWRAYQWSPQSDRLAFLQTDEQPCGIQPIIDFSEIQPVTHPQRYPKAGSTNPTVKLGIWDASRSKLRWIPWTNRSWEYIARFKWVPDGKTLLVQTFNRAQNHLTLWAIDARTLQQRVLLEEKSDRWVDIFGDPVFLEGRDEFLWLSERTGFRHLYLYKLDGKFVRALTAGPWDVSDPFSYSNIRYHTAQDSISFTSTKDSVLEKHFYSVPRQGGEPLRITSGSGSHQLQFSEDGRYAVDQWGSVRSLPSSDLISIQGGHLTNLVRITPEDYAPYRLHPAQIRSFTNSAGLVFYYRMTLPEGFDPAKSYPMVAHVYGEPAGQVVRNSSPDPWESVLAEKGFISASFDARGTPGRGRQWLEAIYKDHATLPLQDWSDWVDHLKSLGFVDTDRLGVWGWSGGGSMTCQLMFQRPGLFKAGAAVAAVGDKRLYDTIYTERYIGLPNDNPEGYQKSSPLFFASKLQGDLLLAHGVSDDNVHVQNVYQLLTELTKAGKPYELYLYPEKDHGIGGKEHRLHLYERLLDFFEKRLSSAH